MKSNKSILAVLTAGLFLLGACESDQDFLKEERKNALTIQNAYQTKSQFEMLIGTMYRSVQTIYNAADNDKDAWPLGLGTDVMFYPMDDAKVFNNWALNNPINSYSSDWYTWQYQIILYANTVIDAAQRDEVKWNNETEKNAIIAEGRFFRGFAYRNLTNIFGGVPIVEKPITEPKVDFVRNSREDCWKFAKADLEFAKTNLPLTSSIPGRVTKAAADHLLAEVNICLKDYDGAIAAATRVIDGTDGAYSLMSSRFGARKAETKKNVFWDLFVMGNQDYQVGNKEAIWVAQFEYNIPGGTVTAGRPLIERMLWNRIWNFTKAGYTGTAHDTTGRGASFVRPTNYANYTVWKNAGADIRNSEACIKRKFFFAADKSGFKKGDLIPKSFLSLNEDTMMYIYPNWQKFGTDKHLNNGQPDNGYVRDFYVIRLPETYLLRAEAYLGKGQKDKAVQDVNVIRARAQAQLATEGQMNIDYILDERVRELFGEEFRMLTLGRLGLIYDRTKRFGYTPAQNSIKEHNNLFPIPQSVIDRNVGAKFEQNSGYY